MNQLGMAMHCMAAVTCAMSPLAVADTIDVPNDYSTIQAAIDAAVPGDTVLVGPGTYYEAIDYLNKNIIVMSSDGPEATMIDGSQTSMSLATLKHCGAPARLQGFTFQNADGGTAVSQDETIIVGGAVRIVAGAPVIENCIFSNCHSGYGGGIHSGGSDVSVLNCQFTNCSASANAGGLLVINGKGTIEGCHFEGNHSTLMGGALHVVNGEGHVIRDSSIVNNTSLDGAGISWHNLATEYSLEISGCTITGNVASDVGGGICSVLESQPVIFTDTTLCDNEPGEIVGPWLDEGGNTLCICAEDLDQDEEVAVDDVLILVSQWGNSPALGDLDGDGSVGVSDLLAVLAAFGPCGS